MAHLLLSYLRTSASISSGKQEILGIPICWLCLETARTLTGTFSSLINSWQVSLASPYKVDKIKCIFHSTLDAKVHAKAVLMHWVSTSKVRILSSYYNTPHWSPSCFNRILVLLKVGPLVLVKNAANCAGCFMKLITPSTYSPPLYFQDRMLPSILGYLHLGSQSTSYNVFIQASSLLRKRWFERIHDTVRPILQISFRLFQKLVLKWEVV